MNVAFDPKLIDHLELREKALKERDARALYQMAQIYASMKGKKNEKKAYELYKSSATHGYAKARFMMGLCNEKGIGVKQNLPMAILPMKWIGSGCTFSVRSRALPQN